MKVKDQKKEDRLTDYKSGFCFSPSAIVSQLSGRDAPRPTMTGASGYASFEFVNNGQIRYQVIRNQLQ